MPHALITFLGRTPKESQGYQRTVYHFPDGYKSEPTAFLGWTLAQRLRPDRVVVLGTQGSMWDFLAEQADIAEESNEDVVGIWQSLCDAVQNSSVEAGLLQRAEPLIAKYLRTEVQLRLIPDGFSEAKQLQLLEVMAGAAEECTELTLDVSHGFRHLPMIAVVAGVYLQAVRNIQIREIWYGFYNPDSKIGAVHDLKGLVHLLEWVKALSKFEHSGDYGVFADLLTTETVDRNDIIKPMRQAAFFERTTRDATAREKINTVRSALADIPLHGVASLFQTALKERLDWAGGDTPYNRQCKLARIYLDRRDYLRASIYAQEAFITYLVCLKGGKPDSYDARDQAKKDYEKEDISPSYKTLRYIRNALVHGTRPTSHLKKTMSDETQLHEAISAFLDEFPTN